MRTFYLGCASAALVVSLSGCGGSGGHVGSAPPAPLAPPHTPPPATAPTTENFETAEYAISEGANKTNAIVAWQQGATGKGVKIGFVDTGLNPNHPELVGKIDPASRDIAGNRPMSEGSGHGTLTSSIAAGAHNGVGMEGVAFDATIVMMKADNGDCDPGCSFDSEDIAKGIDAAVAAGAKVINLSLGGDGSSGIEEAVGRATAAGAVVVIAAGNDTSSTPSEMAREVAAASRGGAIIVGALGVNGGSGVDYNQMTTYSNRAGSSFMGSYVGAPGFLLHGAYQDGYNVVSGTSFAAPVVSGAIALLAQAFPNLTNRQLVELLLTTADDLGATGVDPIFGFGRLNIGRAFQPIGKLSVAGSAVVVSPTFNGSAPEAVGDALERGSLNTIILDTYSRAFEINLARTIRTADRGRPLERAISSDLRSTSFAVGRVGLSMSMLDADADQRLGFKMAYVGPKASSPKLTHVTVTTQIRRTSSIGFSSAIDAKALERKLSGAPSEGFFVNRGILTGPGFSARTDNAVAGREDLGPFAITAFRETGQARPAHIGETDAVYQLYGVNLAGRLARTSWSLGVSRLRESKTILGGRLAPVFGTTGSTTVFIDGVFSHEFGRDWSVTGTARRGWTQFSAGSFRTSAYSLALTKRGLGRSDDQLTILLSQPLRVESGGLAMTLPVSFDYGTDTAVYGRAQTPLMPSARELVVEAAYTKPLPFGLVGLNFYARKHPRHSIEAAPDFGGAFQLKVKL